MAELFKLEEAGASPLRGKVLVLGERSSARIIATQLRHLGLETYRPQDINQKSLRYKGQKALFTELRELFEAFSLFSSGQGMVHPGTTPWAECPELPGIAAECKLLTFCPSSRVLSFFRDQLHFLNEAAKLGIPHLALRGDPMYSVREIQEWMEEGHQSYPFILKGIKKGGPHNICVVHSEADLQKAVPQWVSQMRKMYGEVILFAERYLEGARFITIPFARFKNGVCKVFPMVDSTLQSRYRKLIELCPVPHLAPETKARLTGWTLSLTELCDYVGVGLLEFLVEDDSGYLVGGIPRLNSGFHLWESVCGTEAVGWQVATAGFEVPKSHFFEPHIPEKQAMSLHIYAEDSILQIPQPGVIYDASTQRQWQTKAGSGELYLNLDPGDQFSIFDSGIVGSLYVSSQESLFPFAQEVLDQIWLSGTLQTNERFLHELLGHPWVKEGIFHAGFIDEEFLPNLQPPAEIAKLVVSLCTTQGKAHSWVIGEQLKITSSMDYQSLNWIEGPRLRQDRRIRVMGRVRLPSGQEVRVEACSLGKTQDRWMVRVGKWFFSVRKILPPMMSPSGQRLLSLRSLLEGRVDAVFFQENSIVPAHECLLMIESFGTLVPHSSPIPVRINHWRVKPGGEVEMGQELADLERLG